MMVDDRKAEVTVDDVPSLSYPDVFRLVAEWLRGRELSPEVRRELAWRLEQWKDQL